MAIKAKSTFACYGKVDKLVKGGNNRWYSHYGMVTSLFRSKSALEHYKTPVSQDSSALSNSGAVSVLDIVDSSTFWMKLTLICEILRRLTIEIGMLECRSSNISEVS